MGKIHLLSGDRGTEYKHGTVITIPKGKVNNIFDQYKIANALNEIKPLQTYQKYLKKKTNCVFYNSRCEIWSAK